VSSTLTGLSLVWVIPLVMLLTMICTGLINLGIDRVAYKPLRRASRLAPLITAVGASFVLENIAQNWKGPSQVLYPDIFPTVDILQGLMGLDTRVRLAPHVDPSNCGRVVAYPKSVGRSAAMCDGARGELIARMGTARMHRIGEVQKPYKGRPAWTGGLPPRTARLSES
jgi:hypothetical protein